MEYIIKFSQPAYSDYLTYHNDHRLQIGQTSIAVRAKAPTAYSVPHFETKCKQ